MTLHDIKPRSDGKFSVTIRYSAAPNMFGGFYPAPTYRKIVTAERLEELKAKADKEADQ